MRTVITMITNDVSVFYNLKFSLSLHHLSLFLGCESLTLFFNLFFKQSAHDVLSSDIERKFSLTVHRSHMSAVFDQVPAKGRETKTLQCCNGKLWTVAIPIESDKIKNT